MNSGPSACEPGCTIDPDVAFSLIGALPAFAALHAWRVLRSLSLWIADGCAALPPFTERGMQSLERQILTSVYDDEIRFPLAVITRALTPGADAAQVDRMGYACLCVTEWALARGLYPVSTAFADAAAVGTGLEKYAEVAARLRRAILRQ
jgi:hypothetical protein